MILKNISRLAVLSLSLLSFNAYAVAEGFYMGAMTGPSSTTGGDQQVRTASGVPATTTVNPRSNQWGTRFFIGNKFNQYAGFELGGTFFSDINYDDRGVETCASVNARVRTIDFVGKLDYSVRDTIGIFGKGGAAVSYYTESGGLNSSSTECGTQRNELNFRPTVTVGASYDLNQNWVMELSWTRTLVGYKVNNVDFYALGFSYHFVDQYCGQFLC